MTIVPIMVGSLILTVSLLVRAEFSSKKNQIYFFKPLSALLVVSIIVLSFFVDQMGYGFKTTILVGMLFCLGGDIALMFDSNKAFLWGLVLFLIGHVVYTVAFLVFGGFIWFGIKETAIITLVSVLIFTFLYPGLGRMTKPVVAYVLIICFMVNCATLTFKSDYFNSAQAWSITLGAILFYISDVILAVNRFRFPFSLNRISLYFYFFGQLLIALSTHYFQQV